jgi:hypothetical protein
MILVVNLRSEEYPGINLGIINLQSTFSSIYLSFDLALILVYA